MWLFIFFFFFSSRRRHTRCLSDWSSDVCSSDLEQRGNDEIPTYVIAVAQPPRNADRDKKRSGDHGILVDAIDDEIGRASCREREEILGVAGGVKRKTKDEASEGGQDRHREIKVE